MKASAVLFVVVTVVLAQDPPATKPQVGPTPEDAVSGRRVDQRTPQGMESGTPGGSRAQVMVYGQIRRDDGGPLPGPAEVAPYCGGQRGGSVMTMGRFRILVGRQTVWNAPQGPQAMSSLANCELRIDLSGFEPETVSLTGIAEGTELPMVKLRPKSEVSGYTYSAKVAPDKARAAYEKGAERARRGKLEAARKELEAAVALFPDYATAWFELGTVRHRLGDAAGAREAYEKSMAADAYFLRPVLQLAMLDAGERRWESCLQLTTRVVRQNPFEFPQAFLYKATAEYNLGNKSAAERSVRRAIDLDPAQLLPKARQLLGVILEDRGAFTEALRELRAYLELAPKAPDAGVVRRKIEDLERRAGTSN